MYTSSYCIAASMECKLLYAFHLIDGEMVLSGWTRPATLCTMQSMSDNVRLGTEPFS